jgi:hypothetical protein
VVKRVARRSARGTTPKSSAPKRSAPKRSTSKGKPASARRAGASRATARANPGKAVRGHQWDPTAPQAAAATLPEIRVPRPYTSRYPISNEAFEALKAAAPKAKLLKHTAERSKDPSQPKEELSARAVAPAAPVPGSAPTATHGGSANFAGIASTGWIPPDCTMAAGPQHVLLAVNSRKGWRSACAATHLDPMVRQCGSRDDHIRSKSAL